MDIDLPEVVAEVRAAFDAYEKALMSNDVPALNATFRERCAHHPLRHERKPLRSRRDQLVPRRALAGGPARTLSRTVITTYGRDFAVASTLFERSTNPAKIGRQMQTWVRGSPKAGAWWPRTSA